YDLDPKRVEKFIAEMAGQGPIPRDLRAAQSSAQAVSQADIICSATTSPKPVFADADLKPGVHINGVGSYTPAMREIPPETAGRASMFVGSREGVLAEAGEILVAIERGLISPADLVELGEVVRGNAPGRTSPNQITFFKSVGVAVQDAAAARLALDNAQSQNLGQKINW
ncbi:MAG: ornithine cyclodeaminase family protein, partial [Chloroflexota bacterium]